MSAIGDYIHFHAKGYNDYGIGKRTSKGKNYNNFEADGKSIAKAATVGHLSTNEKEIGELENAINKILSPEVNNGKVDENVKRMHNIIEQMMKKEFKEKMGVIDFVAGNVTAESIYNAKAAHLSSLGPKHKKRRLTTIQNRLQAIEKIMKSIEDLTTYDELRKKIDSIYGILEDMFNLSKNEVLKGDLSVYSGLDHSDIRTETLETLLKEVASILTVGEDLKLQKGTFFEYVIALAGGVAKSLADEKLEEELDKIEEAGLGGIESSVKGGVRTSVRIDFDNFTDKMDWSGVDMHGYSEDEFGFSARPTQQKVDVEISLPDGRSSGISAKNVKMTSGTRVHVLGGSSLLYMIQDINSDFVNHYLNLSAEHTNEDKEEISQYDERANSPAEIEKMGSRLMAARKAMKLILMAKAISGSTYGRQPAELFIINDNTKQGGVQILSIRKMIEKISEDVDKYAQVETKSHEPVENFIFKNRYAESGYPQRIAQLLNDVHSKKIYASIKAPFFK